MIALRVLLSLLVWPFSFAWMAWVCLWSVPLSLFIPFHRWQHRAPAKMLGLIPRFALSRIEVERHPSFDPAQPAVLCANHSSMLDGPVALACLPQPFCGVENEAHFRIPFYGWMMSLGGGVRVPRTPTSGRLPGLIAEARKRVRKGLSVLVFPEGGRTLDGRLKPFHRGGFFMARELGLPVVPVAIRGARRLLPKGSWLLSPTPIRVYIGPPIQTRGLSDLEVERLTEGVRGMISAYVERGERLEQPVAADWRPPEPLPGQGPLVSVASRLAAGEQAINPAASTADPQ